MNLSYLQETLSGITEVKPLGKTAEIKGVLCHLIGLVRYGNILRLAILQYDEKLAEEAEAEEIAQINGLPTRLQPKSQTNRELLHRKQDLHYANSLHSLQAIHLGETQFEINEMETQRCEWHNWQIPVLLTEFLRQGWKPFGIEYQRLDNMFLTFARLEGEYACLPQIGESPEVQLRFRKEYSLHLAEQPVLLQVGTNYPDKLYFQDKDTGESHWIQINQVYLMDVWTEIMKTFNDPRIVEKFTVAELAEHKAEIERRLVEFCPPGMYFPVIEYECEEELTVQFHSQKWLEAVPQKKNSSMGFSIKPEKKTGILGLPLKSAIIDEPVPKDCRIIKAELFSYSLAWQHPDVIIPSS